MLSGWSCGPVLEQALEARIVLAGVPREESGEHGLEEGCGTVSVELDRLVRIVPLALGSVR